MKPAPAIGLAACWSLLLAPPLPPCLPFPLSPRQAADRPGRRPLDRRRPPSSPFDDGGVQPRVRPLLDPAPASAADKKYVPDRVRRRRRRRKDSVVASVDENGAGSDLARKEEGAAAHSATMVTAPQCPLFSMTFPRYRIDLGSDAGEDESERRRRRRVRRGILTRLVEPNSKARVTNDGARGDESWGEMVVRIFKGALDPGPTISPRARQSVEALYRREVQGGAFRWSSSSAGGDVGSDGAPYRDEDFSAAAAFWREASDVASGQEGERRHLALPDTTPSVAHNLCDVLNWYADLLEERAAGEGGRGVTKVIRAEPDPLSDTIPVVRFAVVSAGSDPQLERRRRLLREVLPTAEDTERRTKAWVRRLLVQLGICPFTKSNVKSGQGLGELGVPVANIMYRHSDALAEGGGDVYLLMADAWDAMSDMVAAGPSGRSGVSSILLSAPGFDDDFALWAGPVFAMLETCIGAVQAEGMVGVVCFHPQYVTPDGKSWPGFGHMHSVPRLRQWYNQPDASSLSPSSPNPPLSDNEIAAGGAWQRRTPHAVINVLRAEQLEAAEGRRRSGVLYERNIRILVGKQEGVSIGSDRLAEDLRREQCL